MAVFRAIKTGSAASSPVASGFSLAGCLKWCFQTNSPNQSPNHENRKSGDGDSATGGDERRVLTEHSHTLYTAEGGTSQELNHHSYYDGAFQREGDSSSSSDSDVKSKYRNLRTSGSAHSLRLGKRPSQGKGDDLASAASGAAGAVSGAAGSVSRAASTASGPAGSRASLDAANRSEAATDSGGGGGGDDGNGGQIYENQAFASDLPANEKPRATFSGPEHDDEHLFDVSDLAERAESAQISRCGSVELTFSYDSNRGRMFVIVHQARDIPTKERGGANNTQVRLLLLPGKKLRHKTKIKPGENPVFEETFQFKVPEEDAHQMGLRFRLYGCERMRKERMIGEVVVNLATLSLDTETRYWLTLEPRANLSGADMRSDAASLSLSESGSSSQSLQHGGMPELLLGLEYNSTTGRLSCEVIRGSNFRNMSMQRAPDTYVKLTLMSPTGGEVARSKTSLRRGQPNPVYKETFMFQVSNAQLPDLTLMVSVYNKRSMKRKEMIGWFSLGLNNSGEEELSHWMDMKESTSERISRWHALLES